MLGEPVSRRGAQITTEVFERLPKAAAARFAWFPAMRSGRADLMIFDMPSLFSGGEAFRLWLRGRGICLT